MRAISIGLIRSVMNSTLLLMNFMSFLVVVTFYPRSSKPNEELTRQLEEACHIARAPLRLRTTGPSTE